MSAQGHCWVVASLSPISVPNDHWVPAISVQNAGCPALRAIIRPLGVPPSEPLKLSLDSAWRGDLRMQAGCLLEPGHAQRPAARTALSGGTGARTALSGGTGAKGGHAGSAMHTSWRPTRQVNTPKLGEGRDEGRVGGGGDAGGH